MSDLELMGAAAQRAARQFALAPTGLKNEAIRSLSDLILSRSDMILEANKIDVAGGEKSGLSSAMIDRLTLNQTRLEDEVDSLRNITELPDPIGERFDEENLPNGLRVHKQRVPLGVLGVIYEARPNITLDIAGLAIKTGNTVILRGSSDTINSNRILVELIHESLEKSGIPKEVVQFIDDPSRERVLELLKLHRYVDMIIPRGGAALHEFCRENSNIPVITGGIGICHLYVDQTADMQEAVKVIRNAKIQRPSVCNSLDNVLVQEEIAGEFLPLLIERLIQDGVTFRADKSALEYLSLAGGETEVPELSKAIKLAEVEDFDTEWLSLVLGIKVVKDLDEAIEHIANHSTGHSDGILTGDKESARRFIAEVDSAAVYVNASTRFTDGGQLGLGAEVAISTQRLHARGPMGLRELTTYKWVIEGEYHIRA